MSWSHSDYINLIASIGGVGSAIFAAYTAFQAKRTIELSTKESEKSRILDELYKLAEWCNKCVGEDSYVIEKSEKLIELATACYYAKQAITNSNVTESEKESLREVFTRQLRPSINGEIGSAQKLKIIKEAYELDALREMYREAQVFLKTNEREPLPEKLP
ncbi:hypothetical protein V5M88_001494 [Enterobacter hormaechei]|uniref:hypothetical protein n=1 Tax=Enterobacter hormaechei TaxID=158836 RepID=UPI000F89380D|nr:hypothetical protein [Enterobacter hormaechei]MCE1444268.1 hypothetical protein [Enterobacter hormaechei]MCE1452638.1 hypothetical protein [Enterobacter hormaechei]RTO92222.1 hypothetical protein EKN54_02570 [Enterobacter hormaechei]HEM8104992.1 hypothetical protein [Enterobacter hormaechei]HEM8123900.1 hypothetical protein [Enterobacter hormaechei]